MTDTDYEDLLARQLVMNRQTWAALVRRGITEQSMVRLDFSYNVCDSEPAEAWRVLLLEQTDYDIRVASQGSSLRSKWRVEGSTQETGISPEIVDQWVTWMVTAGKETTCDFDGWGTSG